MDEALRLAEFMAKARTVPKHLQDSPGDCLMVVELAMRWGMSPFAVAQGTSVISGKLMIEGKLVAAAVESSGAISGHIDYAFHGEGETRSIEVAATRRGETSPRLVTVTLKEARTSNDMWKRQPDQQLVYHGTRVWARRWTPAVILGVYSREEMGIIIDGQSEEVLDDRDALNASVPIRPAAAATPRPPRVAEKPSGERTDEQWRVWLDKLRAACGVLYSRAEVVEIGERASVADAIAKGPPWVRQETSAILAEAYAKHPEADDADASHEPADVA
jgi:hypothetical protein